jgi:hypothetical protein
METAIHRVITLSNGKRVANFSSPHPFTFEDGSILPAVPDEYAEKLKVTFHEDLINDGGDIVLDFSLSPDVWKEIRYWQHMYDNRIVDVVFCPLPMIRCLQDDELKNDNAWLVNSPFRSIRIKDRIKKLVSITNQCL